MNPWYHAVSSAQKHGGAPEDYLKIHEWFDESKAHYADFRHRALRHHSAGIFECQEKFGTTITNSQGRQIPARTIGEQHVREDCGFIPTVADWLKHIKAEPWMTRVAVKPKDLKLKQAGYREALAEMSKPEPIWIDPEFKYHDAVNVRRTPDKDYGSVLYSGRVISSSKEYVEVEYEWGGETYHEHRCHVSKIGAQNAD